MVTFGKHKSIHLQTWKLISEREFSVVIDLDSAVILNIKERTENLHVRKIS